MNTKRLQTGNNVSRETFNRTHAKSLVYFVSRETFNRFTTRDLLVVLFHGKHSTIHAKPLACFVSRETFSKFVPQPFSICFTGNILTDLQPNLSVVLFHGKHSTISTKSLAYFVSRETFLICSQFQMQPNSLRYISAAHLQLQALFIIRF